MARRFVDDTITSAPVVVFAKRGCPYCRKARDALDRYMDVKEAVIVYVEDRDDGSRIQDHLKTLTGGRTVPRVFINGEFVGGGDDMTKMARNGELRDRLEEAGAIERKD